MAEEPGATPAKPDNKGGLLKKKVGGIPVPILLVVGGIGAYYLYSKRKASTAAATPTSTATPTDTSGQATGTSGGYLDTGSGSGSAGYTSGGGTYDPNAAAATTATTSPTDTSSLTPAPTATVNQSNITPIGQKTIQVGGKSFNTVSGFIQNGNTYYGINNPAEAKKLEAQGVHLVKNPNDPNGRGLFVLVPKGKSGPVIKKPPAKKPVKKKAPARG